MMFLEFELGNSIKLKSDQGGIERKVRPLGEAHVPCLLKSDQDGIESSWAWFPFVRPWPQLKSDQDGIERQHSRRMHLSQFCSWNQTKMGLKGYLADCLEKGVPPESWNQTKMGLKACSKHVTLTFASFVEIRPRWDWKRDDDGHVRYKPLLVEIRPRWDWKYTYASVLLVTHNKLKSDQDGIESMIWLHFSALRRAVLKSDQDGIERAYIKYLHNHSLVISWNQTKMGLKVHITSIIFWFSKYVEIRPRWDWKQAGSYEAYRLTITSWNQTKMGLKESGEKRMAKVVLNVEIRPRWDWKVGHVLPYTKRVLHVLKSDQDGIERL